MTDTTRTSDPMYTKIIGNNHGRYPYRVGLNTLAHNGEHFDPRPECGSGGLYYCEIKGIFEWLSYGDTLCIVKPVGQIVPVGDKFKTDKLVIESMMSLLDIETWKFLVERGADVHAGDNNALRWAALGGRIEVLKFLVEHGADIHVYDEYALRWAATYGHLEVVKFLVEHGASVQADDNRAVQWAAWKGHLEVVKFLAEHGANVRECGALQLVAENGHLEVVKFLVESGADAHALNDAAMHRAAKNGHHDVVAYLKNC